MLGTLWGASQLLPVFYHLLKAPTVDSAITTIADSSLGEQILDKIDLLCQAAKYVRDRKTPKSVKRGGRSLATLARVKSAFRSQRGSGHRADYARRWRKTAVKRNRYRRLQRGGTTHATVEDLIRGSLGGQVFSGFPRRDAIVFQELERRRRYGT